MRGQTSLPALGIALVVLVTTTLFALSVADGQLVTADREAVERGSTLALTDRLVAQNSPVTTRENVLRDGALGALSVDDLREAYGLGPESAVRVSLEGESVVEAGDPDGGTTIERIVLVENRTTRTIRPHFDSSRRVTLPRRSPSLSLEINPAGNATVETVRANDAVILEDPGGLSGRYDVRISRYETATLAFDGTGDLTRGDVTVAYRPAGTRKARLRVTVDRWGDSDG